MKTQQEFDDYYTSDITPSLAILIQARNKVFVWSLMGIIIIICQSIFFWHAIINNNKTFLAESMPFITFITIIAFVIIKNINYNNYNLLFKKLVIGKLISFIDDTLLYKPLDKIEKHVFYSSLLFSEPKEFDNVSAYVGHDLVTGKSANTKFYFSAVKVKRTVSLMTLVIGAFLFGLGLLYLLFFSARRIIFKGMFFTSAFNKTFTGKTFVLSTGVMNSLSDLGKSLHISGKNKGELVALENPEFARQFSVYSNDQVEARYILTPTLTERIMKFQVDAQSGVELSFVDSSVFITIPSHEDMFQANLFSKVLDKEMIQRYFYYLQLALGIVEELDLGKNHLDKAPIFEK